MGWGDRVAGKALAIVMTGSHIPRTCISAERMWWLICNTSMQEAETGFITASWLTRVAKTVNSGLKRNSASIILIK